MLTCITCGRPLEKDEVALTKKLINRGATQYLCIDCLAKKFEVTREDLEKKIEEFRQMGCTLFL
ncbi:MAG: hypothetical protein SPE01_04535 [Candidatus Spyradocola sp.]|nr:hypothetical protein [Candidatus Spyradocola sp.]